MAPGGSAIKVIDVTSGKLLHDFIHDPTNPTSAPLGGGIKCFFQDTKKNVWIGSNGGGLSLYNPGQNNFTHFTEKDGLPNNVVYGILEDDNQNLWLSTNKGLCEFNPITKKVRNFDVYDGLQSNEFNTGASYKSASGTMYFGGVNGLTYFHPKNIVTSNSIPQSAIAGFYVNNNLLKDYSAYVSKDKENLPVFTLQYNERDFGFDVVGIGFSLPGRTRYRYMLENYDNQWHDIGNLQHISFTNIPAGEYVFKVQSSDPYGNWEEIGASIQVIIQSSIWRNPWVWTIFLFAVGAVTATTINARIKYSKKRNQEKLLQQENLLRISIETQEEERKRIAQDLHDELGAILSITRMHIVQLQDQGENANTKIGLQQVRTLSESALATMRRISHELMPPQLVEFGLTKTLQALVTQLNETKKIACSFLPPDENIRLPKSVELGIYRVCMELVNNTLKHANATHIHIQLLHGEHSVLFAYSDNGKGLPENYSQGHGFKNIEARINTLGGDLKFGNRDEGGFYASLRLEVVQK
jgi:signal transduction histidine kinase